MWWEFLIIVIFICFCLLLVCYYEFQYGSKITLQRVKPRVILCKIVVMVFSFYGVFAIVVFTLDVLFQELFWGTQIFTSHDKCSFHSKRGNIALVAHFITWLVFAIPVVGIVGSSKQLYDFVFTQAILHFIVVSAADKGFINCAPWWIAFLLGVLLCLNTSELISYKLETVEYRSTMAGKERNNNHSNNTGRGRNNNNNNNNNNNGNGNSNGKFQTSIIDFDEMGRPLPAGIDYENTDFGRYVDMYAEAVPYSQHNKFAINAKEMDNLNASHNNNNNLVVDFNGPITSNAAPRIIKQMDQKSKSENNDQSDLGKGVFGSNNDRDIKKNHNHVDIDVDGDGDDDDVSSFIPSDSEFGEEDEINNNKNNNNNKDLLIEKALAKNGLLSSPPIIQLPSVVGNRDIPTRKKRKAKRKSLSLLSTSSSSSESTPASPKNNNDSDNKNNNSGLSNTDMQVLIDRALEKQGLTVSRKKLEGQQNGSNYLKMIKAMNKNSNAVVRDSYENNDNAISGDYVDDVDDDDDDDNELFVDAKSDLKPTTSATTSKGYLDDDDDDDDDNDLVLRKLNSNISVDDLLPRDESDQLNKSSDSSIRPEMQEDYQDAKDQLQ